MFLNVAYSVTVYKTGHCTKLLAITADRVRQKGQSHIPRLKDFGNMNFTAFTHPTLEWVIKLSFERKYV